MACKVIVARGGMALILLCLTALAAVGCSDGAEPAPTPTTAPASGNLLTPVPVLPDGASPAFVPEEGRGDA